MYPTTFHYSWLPAQPSYAILTKFSTILGKAIMDKTILEIPTELLQAAKLTPEEAKTELAIRLYQLHKLNDKQAGELAGDPKAIETLVWNNRETGHFEFDDFLDW